MRKPATCRDAEQLGTKIEKMGAVSVPYHDALRRPRSAGGEEDESHIILAYVYRRLSVHSFTFEFLITAFSFITLRHLHDRPKIDT